MQPIPKVFGNGSVGSQALLGIPHLTESGYDGLYDRRKRWPSPKRVPLKTAEKVLQLDREKYFDFNLRQPGS